jgi:hypothetical protein
MKRIIIIITVCTFWSCRAQNIYNINEVKTTSIKPPYYIKDINHYYDDIVGVWKWENGNNSFELVLQEFEMFSYPQGSGNFIDSLYGKYKYIINGNVVSEVTEILPTPNFSVSLIFESINEYKIIITDQISEITKTGTFNIISSTTVKIEFFDIKGIVVGGNGNGQEWSLPNSLTLIKQ